MTASGLANYPSLEGRGVFITGGATGIGAAFVEAFARNGAQVAFVDIAEEEGEKLAQRIRAKFSANVSFQALDVLEFDRLERAIADSGEQFGGMHVLINNVADDSRHSVEDCDAERWRRCMALNLDCAYIASRAVMGLMQQGGKGAVINISSINALLGFGRMPGYVTAKAGLGGLTKALARDFGKYGIRVNAILPGWVATKKQLETWLTEKAEAEWSKHVALQRRLLPEDVANLALFLAADDSDMITGQCFVIDAGRT